MFHIHLKVPCGEHKYLKRMFWFFCKEARKSKELFPLKWKESNTFLLTGPYMHNSEQGQKVAFMDKWTSLQDSTPNEALQV